VWLDVPIGKYPDAYSYDPGKGQVEYVPASRLAAAERERDEANAESLRRLTARQEAEATVDRLRGLLRDAMGLTFPESQPQDYGDFCDARRKWIAEARRELGGGGARDAGACPTCGRSCNCQPDTCPTCGGTGRKP
jgi:hypothetical protein